MVPSQLHTCRNIKLADQYCHKLQEERSELILHTCLRRKCPHQVAVYQLDYAATCGTDWPRCTFPQSPQDIRIPSTLQIQCDYHFSCHIALTCTVFWSLDLTSWLMSIGFEIIMLCWMVDVQPLSLKTILHDVNLPRNSVINVAY